MTPLARLLSAPGLPRFAVDREQTRLARRRRRELDAAWDAFVHGETPAAALDPRAGLAHHPVYAAWTEGDADWSLSKAALRAHPRPFNVKPRGRELLWSVRTSGTTGKPMTVLYSSIFQLANFYQLHLKAAHRAGVTGLGRRDIFCVYLSDNPGYRARVYPRVGPRAGATVFLPLRGTSAAEAAQAARRLLVLGPEVLATKPSLLRVMLASPEVARGSLRGRFKMLVSGGSMLDDATRRRAEELFDCPVVSVYAAAELGYIGSECPRRSFHLDATRHRAEVKGADGRVRTEGTGRLLVTSLANRWFPLARYEVGDQASLAQDGCPCGRPGPHLSALSGRVVPVFRLFNGDSVVPSRWMRVFERAPGLKEFQLLQRSDRRFHVLAEFSGKTTPRRLARLIAAFRAGLPPELEFSAEAARLTGREKLVRFISEVPHG